MLPLNADGDTVAGMSNRRIFNLSCFFGVIVCALFLAPLAALRAMVPLVPCSSHNYGFKANASGGGQGAAGFVARRQRMHPYAILLASRPQPLGPPSTRNYDRNMALGPMRIALDGGVVPHVNSWATLRLILPPLSGGNITVEIQDRRGGPMVRRRLAVYRRHILMPLAYVAGADGLGGAWPVVVKLFRSGELLRVMRAKVDMPLAHAEGAISLAVPRAIRSEIPALARALGKPVVPVLFSRRQLAGTPVLNVASCRWLLLNGATAQQLSSRRVMALLSLGMRLVYIGGGRSRLLPSSAWRTIGKSAHGLAIWKTLRLNGFSHGPPVIVPHLSRMRLPPVHAPRSWETVAWAIGPVTILMVILLGWAVPRGWYFILSLVIGVALLSAAAVCFLTATTAAAHNTFQWQTDFPAAAVRIGTTIGINRALHGSGWVAPPTRGITLPLAWSARAWLAFHGVISLHGNTTALAYSMTRHVTILASQTRATVNSTLPRGGFMASSGLSGVRASGVPNGYSALFASGQIFLAAQPRRGRDFYNWLHHQPSRVQSTLRLWLLLQFNPHGRYALFTSANRLGIMPLARQAR